jgi:hypothetical protein
MRVSCLTVTGLNVINWLTFLACQFCDAAKARKNITVRNNAMALSLSGVESESALQATLETMQAAHDDGVLGDTCLVDGVQDLACAAIIFDSKSGQEYWLIRGSASQLAISERWHYTLIEQQKVATHTITIGDDSSVYSHQNWIP